MITGYLLITTIPIAGDIYINNEYSGTEYLNIKLNVGRYKISFGYVDGYKIPQDIIIDIISDESISKKIIYELL